MSAGSASRDSLTGSLGAPGTGGESWWRGVLARPAGLHDWSAWLCRAGTFLALPIGGGLAYWAAGAYTASPFGDPAAGRAARVRDRFGDVTGVHAQVLAHVLDDARVQFSAAQEAWVEMPVRGRVVLVGDAWHATTPSMAQGASMAAEDALVLAHELAAARGHHGRGRTRPHRRRTCRIGRQELAQLRGRGPGW